MTTNPYDPALVGAMTFYSAGMYPVFDRIGAEASREAADFCSQWTLEQPLCRDKKGEFPQRDVPHFGQQSIVYAATMLAAFLVWRQKGQHMASRGPLIEAALMGWRMYEKPEALLSGGQDDTSTAALRSNCYPYSNTAVSTSRNIP